MGNIIKLIGLGKKVYIRREITTWKFFNEINVSVFDFDSLNLEKISNDITASNKEKIKSYFSQNNYLIQLNNLFN